MADAATQSELSRAILNLKDGDHLCLFYEKDPAEQMPALVPFIQDGLAKDEQFIYIADDQTVDELADRLERSGIKVTAEVDRGALKLWTRSEWRQPGELSAEKKSLQVREFIRAAAEAGFSGSRFAVEMTWTLGPDIEAAALEVWEAALNRIFMPGFPGRITCQYNRSRLAPEALVAAFHTHPVAILGDNVYPNWFYEAPLILDGAANGESGAKRLEWMISVLERSRAAQREREELIAKRTALAEAESARKNLERILAAMPAAVYRSDEQGRITYFNRGALDLWGRAPDPNADAERYNGPLRLNRLDGTPIGRDEDATARALATGESTRNEEMIAERSDGTRTFVSLNVDPLCDAEGQRAGAITVLQDITGFKTAEQSRQRLAAIVESADDAIVSKNLNGIITSWNQGAERLFGYTEAESIGQSITMLIPPDRLDEEPKILAQIRSGNRIDHYETVRQRKDGRLVQISLTISPVRDASGAIVGASKIARDIGPRIAAEAALGRMRDDLIKANEELERRVRERTADLEEANAARLREMEEERRLRAQLLQAQKMEGIGTLAGGIAHDFNNVLNIIKGYAAMIACHPAADAAIAGSVSVIDEHVERGAAVVRQLLTLGRKTEARLAPTSIDEVISALVHLLKQTFPKNIAIDYQSQPLPTVAADANQITQALLNLCVNARDAMPAGGRLKLRTFLADADKLDGRVGAESQAVGIEIADTGSGIDPSIRSRVFDPFFTTKGVGEGTGLGLPMVYAVIKNHHGSIELESELGRGTIFRIYLSALGARKDAGTNGAAAPAPPPAEARGKRTLLVAEDEPAMVLLLEKMLPGQGYDVIAAMDGEEVVEVYRRRKDEIDAVLLDIGLPKLAGWEVLLKLKEENPEVRVMVASGYIDAELKTKLREAGVREFIGKPYRLESIVAALGALDQGVAAS